MMKKHIIILATLISLIGCSVQDTNKDLENNDSNIVEKNEDDNNSVEEENEEVIVEEDQEVNKYDRYEYIAQVFADNNYQAPAQSEWIVKDEGQNKVAVIIKVPVSKAKPLITKLIFLEKDVNEIVFLQIENKIIIP